MQVINCLNLCEILPYLKQHKEIHEIIEEALTLAGYKTVERIYLGSSFCGKYFLMQSENDLKEIDEICRQYKMKITLVVPVFSESDLERGKKKIQEILGEYCEIIDEVTVNDYAMAIYMHEKHKININLGRMFMKDYRDPRYDEYFEIPWKPKMFTDYLIQFIQNNQIKGCELDITHRYMELKDILEDLTVGFHIPFCYQTVGRICEYGSISKEIEKKFRANDICDKGCAEHIIKYSVTDGNIEYVRIGRTVYFRHLGYELRGIEQYREIYFPLDLK